MILIEGAVKRTALSLRLPIEPVTSGCKNSVFLHLRFSKYWRDYTERTVEFRASGGRRAAEPVSRAGLCTVPEKMLEKNGRIYLSVVGRRRTADGEETARVATELVPLRVTRSGLDGGERTD